MDYVIFDDYVFDFFYGMALNDAMNRVSKDKEKERIQGNKDIRNIIKEHYTNIVENENYHADIKKLAETIKNLNKGSYEIENLTFGKIQKIINMTMKYMYLKHYDNPDIANRFDKCDAPMDSIMINFVFRSCKELGIEDKETNFNKECAWSKLDDEPDDDKDNLSNYTGYQKAVAKIIEKKNLKINAISFDYMFWDEAKKLKDMGVSKQKEEVKKIWVRY